MVYGLWLNRQGKVQGDSFIFTNRNEISSMTYYLFSPYTESSIILKHLERHIIADQVFLKDLSQEYLCTQLAGSVSLQTEDSIREFPGNNNQPPESFIFGDTRIKSVSIIYCLLLRSGTKPANSSDLLESFRLKGWVIEENENIFERERILCGIPSIPTDIGSDNYPQDGDLEQIGAFSLTKGCYLGQEVMLRKKKTGRKNKRLYIVVSGQVLTPGDLLFKDNLRVGHISSAILINEQYFGLALLRTETALSANAFSLQPGGMSCVQLQPD